MTTAITPHLNFQGNARQALSFYHSVFGGELSIVTYANAEKAEDASSPDDVIWGQVRNETGFRMMAYDVQTSKSWNPGENAFYMVLESNTTTELTGYWDKLAESAEILQPLLPSPWSSLYGMLKDNFGTVWVCSVASSE